MRATPLVLVLLAVTWSARTAVAEDGWRTAPCLQALDDRLDAIGDPKADEVRSYLAELRDSLADLERDGRALDEEQEALDSDEWHLQNDIDHLSGLGRHIDRDQKTLNNDWGRLRGRILSHNSDATSQNMCAAAAFREAEVNRCNSWGARVNSRRAGLLNEISRFRSRQKDIDARRDALARRLENLAPVSNVLDRKRNRVMGETGSVLSRCAALRARAEALYQIRDAPAGQGNASYQTPQQIARHSMGVFFKSVGEQTALAGLETEEGRRAFTHVFRRLGGSRAGNLASGAATHGGGAYAAVTTAADITTAGVDQRTREVERNILLIGDYGAAMKALVDEKGGAAQDDPAYQTMRDELKRLAAGMPTTGTQTAAQGLGTAGAVQEAFLAAAKQYVVGPTIRKYATAFKNARFSPTDKQVWGAAGEALFEKGVEIRTTAAVDVLIDAGKRRLAGESRVRPVTQTQPVSTDWADRISR